MRNALVSIAALITSLGVLLAGNSLQFVVLGLRATAEDFSFAIIGAMTAAYYIGYALGSLRAPHIVARIGHIRTFVAAGSIISAVVLAHALWVQPVFWVLLRLITGLCFAGLATVAESWVNGKATRENRGRLLAIFSVVAIGGYAVGPVFVVLGSVDGAALFIIASVLMSVALVPVTVTRFAAPPLPDTVTGDDTYSLRRLLKETPLGIVGCIATGFMQGAVLGLGAVFAAVAGLGDWQASLFMTGALIAGAVCQYPLGWLSDKVDRRLVIAGSAGAVGLLLLAGMGLLLLGGGTLVAMAVIAFALGAGAMPIYPLVIAHINDRLPETSIVSAAAALLLAFSIGSALSGPLISAALDLGGAPGFLVLLAAVAAGLGGFSLLRARLGEPLDGGDTTAVVTAPGAFATFDAEIEEDQLWLPFPEWRAA
ncbi:MAG: MFS transporter [Azospirillaceae bacterium]